MPLDLFGGLIAGTPIFPGDFADPFLLAEPKALFIYATNTDTANVPVTRILIGDISMAGEGVLEPVPHPFRLRAESDESC